MSPIEDSVEPRIADALPQLPGPAAWKIVLATTLVGPCVGLLCLALLGAIWAWSTGSLDLRTARTMIEPAPYVFVFGLVTSLVSGLLVSVVARKRRWLRWHQTIAVAAASCLTPLGLGLVSLPITSAYSGFSLPLVGIYAGVLMLPVAIVAAIISRPIILWLLNWKRPVTI